MLTLVGSVNQQLTWIFRWTFWNQFTVWLIITNVSRWTFDWNTFTVLVTMIWKKNSIKLISHNFYKCQAYGIVCRLVVFFYSLDKFQSFRVLDKSVGLNNQDRNLQVIKKNQSETLVIFHRHRLIDMMTFKYLKI